MRAVVDQPLGMLGIQGKEKKGRECGIFNNFGLSLSHQQFLDLPLHTHIQKCFLHAYVQKFL